MLPSSSGDTQSEKLQWAVYQLRILEKVMVQYSDAIKSGNVRKIGLISDLIYDYGDSMSTSEFEFDYERLSNQKSILERARDFVL